MWGTPANSANNPATLHEAIPVLKESSACRNTQEHLGRLGEVSSKFGSQEPFRSKAIKQNLPQRILQIEGAGETRMMYEPNSSFATASPMSRIRPPCVLLFS